MNAVNTQVIRLEKTVVDYYGLNINTLYVWVVFLELKSLHAMHVFLSYAMEWFHPTLLIVRQINATINYLLINIYM